MYKHVVQRLLLPVHHAVLGVMEAVVPVLLVLAQPHEELWYQQLCDSFMHVRGLLIVPSFIAHDCKSHSQLARGWLMFPSLQALIS